MDSFVLRVIAALVLTAGTVFWTFQSIAESCEWVLPALSILGLGLALRLGSSWSGLNLYLLPLAAALVIGWSKVPHVGTSLRHFAGASLGVQAMLLIPAFVDKSERLRLVALAYLATAVAVVILGSTAVDPSDLSPERQQIYHLLQSNRWLPRFHLRIEGTNNGGVVNPNALSSAVLLVLPLGLASFSLRSSHKLDLFGLKPLGAGLIAVGGLALLVFGSRTAWIAVWLVLVGALALGTMSKLWRGVVAVAIVAPLFVGLVLVASMQWSSLEGTTEDFWKTVQTRRQILSEAVVLLKGSPWVGIGLNEFRNAAQRRQGADKSVDIVHAHNVFLQTALDIGIPGLLAYCGTLVYVLRKAKEAARGPSELARRIAVGASLSLLAVSAFGLADAVALGARVGIFHWVAAGLILASWRIQFHSRDELSAGMKIEGLSRPQVL